MVKCAECGFLALHCKTGERGFAQADRDARINGIIDTSLFMAVLECSAGMPFLCQEIGDIDSTQAAAVAPTIINKERECPKYRTWTPGFSPKEHYEMMMSEQGLQEQREWHQRVEAENRRHNRRWEIIMAAIGIITALVNAIVVAVALTMLGLKQQ